MALTHSPETRPGALAPDFSLPGTDNKTHTLSDFARARALVVVFMCNHCPYVIAVQDRINRLAREYQPLGVALVGINSNNSATHPADSFEAMKVRAREQGFAFPYLHDETQAVARAYGAVCTPDPFLYAPAPLSPNDGRFELRYRGRIDDCWQNPASVTRRELAAAIDAVLAGKPVDPDIKPAMGCSIKWK